MTSAANLPANVATLQALLMASEERHVRKEDRIVRLEKLLADFKRALYGAKSEKGHPDQYNLALEDIETAMAVVHAEDEAVDPPKVKAPKSCAGRCVLPKHLPRIEEIIAPDVTCGRGANVTSLARTSATGWTSCRRSSAPLSRAVPNIHANPVRQEVCKHPPNRA